MFYINPKKMIFLSCSFKTNKTNKLTNTMATNKDIEQILETFVHTVNASTEELLTLRDLKHMLKCSFDMHYAKPKKTKKDPNKPKKPREPNTYNLFVKERMAELKIHKPTMPAQDKMKEIGKLWRSHKENKKLEEDLLNEDGYNDNNGDDTEEED